MPFYIAAIDAILACRLLMFLFCSSLPIRNASYGYIRRLPQATFARTEIVLADREQRSRQLKPIKIGCTLAH